LTDKETNEEAVAMETENEADNNNTTEEKKEEIKTSVSPPSEVFQTIVNMFPEKSWTEEDIKNR